MDDNFVVCGQNIAELKPSAELRFVQRYMPDPLLGAGICTGVRVLQQKWVASARVPDGGVWEEHRWRDVPLVEETPNS